MPTAEAAHAYALAKQRMQQNEQLEHRAEPKVQHSHRMVDLFTIILAILSILFAGVQFVDSRELKGRTESILASTTTRYVAQFPDNIPHITELIEGTCSQLDIMADVPGYGAYSNAKAYLEYREAILKVAARQGVQDGSEHNCLGKGAGHDIARTRRHPLVRLLLFAPSDRDHSMKSQFDRTAYLNRMSTADAQDQLRAFLDMNREPLGSKSIDEYIKEVRSGEGYQGLLSYLLRNQHRQEEDFHNGGVEIRYARTPSNQLRLWIQDSADAAFSFDHQPEAGGETEISFRTHDTSLVNTFEEIFDARWNDGVCFADYWNAANKTSNVSASGLKSGCTGPE